jgi:hypothetical protein
MVILVEKTITEEVLSQQMIRLLNFFAELVGSDYEYSKTELAAGAGIGYPSLFRLWPLIEKFDLLIPTRSFGRIQLYKVNSDSPVLRKYLAFALELGFAAAGSKEGMPSATKERAGAAAVK